MNSSADWRAKVGPECPPIEGACPDVDDDQQHCRRREEERIAEEQLSRTGADRRVRAAPRREMAVHGVGGFVCVTDGAVLCEQVIVWKDGRQYREEHEYKPPGVSRLLDEC